MKKLKRYMLFLISPLSLPLLSSPSIPHFFTHLFSFQLTITVTAVFDTNPELNETYSISLEDPIGGGRISDENTIALITILSNQDPFGVVELYGSDGYVCMYIIMYVTMYVCMYVHIMYVYVYNYMYVYMYVCMYVCLNL